MTKEFCMKYIVSIVLVLASINSNAGSVLDLDGTVETQNSIREGRKILV